MMESIYEPDYKFNLKFCCIFCSLSVLIHKVYTKETLLQLNHLRSFDRQTRSKDKELCVCCHVILHKDLWCTKGKVHVCYSIHIYFLLPYYSHSFSFFSKWFDISQILLCTSHLFGWIFAEHLTCQREWKNILSQVFFW